MTSALKPPILQQPVITATAPAPAAAPAAAPRQKCTANFEKDGSLTVQFSVSPEMAQRFVRNASGGDLVKYIWDSRGLRHFEHQPLS